MDINWHNIGTIVAVMIAVGGVMIALMKGFFMTSKACTENQDKCQTGICKKIDGLKDDIEEDRKTIHTNYAEIKGILGEIIGKLDA